MTKFQYGTRGRVSQNDVEDARMTVFLQEFVREHQLSWVVGLFSGKDRWVCERYDARINDHGQLVIGDRQFDMEVHLYAAAGIDWHSLRVEFMDQYGEWTAFHPTAEYNKWKKDNPQA